MKKKLFGIVAAVAVLAALLVGLCACANTFGSVKSALENAGFEEVELSDEYKAQVKEAYGDAGERASKSNDDLIDALRDKLTDEQIEDAYNELQKLDIVSGNCVLLAIGDFDGAALKAFKSTKG